MLNVVEGYAYRYQVGVRYARRGEEAHTISAVVCMTGGCTRSVRCDAVNVLSKPVLPDRICVGDHPSSIEDFNPLWISKFNRTNPYEV